jgi:hypothetical protein
VLSADTLNDTALPDVLYALGEDEALRAIERRGDAVVVVP